MEQAQEGSSWPPPNEPKKISFLILSNTHLSIDFASTI